MSVDLVSGTSPGSPEKKGTPVAFPWQGGVWQRFATNWAIAVGTSCRSLPADLGQYILERIARHADQPLEGLIQVEDEQDRRGHRSRADKKNDGDGGVSRREQPQAQEEHGEPEDQDHEERRRNRAVL